jgi:hypothetical protein
MNLLGRLVCLALVALSMSGCLSSQYKPAQKTIPPAIPMNIGATVAPVEAMVNTVIVFQGPGSWKKYAMWDEYVITLTNRGDTTLSLQAATLVGAGQSVLAQHEPWQLEKTSRLAQREGFGMGKDTVVHVGYGLAGFLAVSGTGAALGLTSSGGIFTGAAAAGVGAAAATVVAIPVFIGGTIYRNVSNRHDIEREFHRRRFTVPVAIAPEQTVQGTFFFPITPAPQRLIFHFFPTNPPTEASIELTPINGLHLKPSPAPSTP